MYPTIFLAMLLVCLCQEGITAKPNADCKTVTVKIRDSLTDQQETVATAIVKGFDENVLHTLMRASKANAKFEFSVSYDKSSGFQLTGINGQKNTKTSRWEVLRSPHNSSVLVAFTSGLERLVPDTGDTIIFDRKQECGRLDNPVLQLKGEDRIFVDAGDIMSDKGVDLPILRRKAFMTFDAINIKEMSVEYVTDGEGKLSFSAGSNALEQPRYSTTENMGSMGSNSGSVRLSINGVVDLLGIEVPSDLNVKLKNLCIKAGE